MENRKRDNSTVFVYNGDPIPGPIPEDIDRKRRKKFRVSFKSFGQARYFTTKRYWPDPWYFRAMSWTSP